MSTYTPRRASKTRWLQDAPEYILDCFDDPRTCDRYTVMFTGNLLVRTPEGATFIPYLGMSGDPTHPQGFSQWGELNAVEQSNYRYENGKRRVRWNDLPEHIRKHVITRATQD